MLHYVVGELREPTAPLTSIKVILCHMTDMYIKRRLTRCSNICKLSCPHFPFFFKLEQSFLQSGLWCSQEKNQFQKVNKLLHSAHHPPIDQQTTFSLLNSHKQPRPCSAGEHIWLRGDSIRTQDMIDHEVYDGIIDRRERKRGWHIIAEMPFSLTTWMPWPVIAIHGCWKKNNAQANINSPTGWCFLFGRQLAARLKLLHGHYMACT